MKKILMIMLCLILAFTLSGCSFNGFLLQQFLCSFLHNSTTVTSPTVVPTAKLTAIPSSETTVVPTIIPTLEPTVVPTATPTVEPSPTPTIEPTATPTIEPTTVPTAKQGGSIQLPIGP